MTTYVYQAALYCEDCGQAILNDPKVLADRSPRSSGYWEPTDSECAPQPVTSDEADCPQHCADCGEFLRNRLTSEGRRYVAQALIDYTGDPDVLEEWADEYGFMDTGSLDNDEVKALREYADNVGPEYALETWEEAFRGIHASPEEFAYDLADAIGWIDHQSNARHYFDAEAFARDLELGGDYYFVKLGYASVAVFDNHV